MGKVGLLVEGQWFVRQFLSEGCVARDWFSFFFDFRRTILCE